MSKRQLASSVVKHCYEKYLSPSLRTFQAYDFPFEVTRGNMQYIWDANDTKYSCWLGMNLCNLIGYSHPRLLKAQEEQSKKLSHCTTMYLNEEPAMLAKELVETMPPHPSGEDWVCHFVNSGSEAVDLAIQMAQVHTGRSEMYSLYKAYHGLQGYAAGATAIGKATQPNYASMFGCMRYIPSNDVEHLKENLQFTTGGKVAGIMMESLQGYGGIFPLKDGYMKESFDLIREYGGVAIADEVQSGYGRCGEYMWGFMNKNNDSVPDMVTIAKGMGGSLGIIGAVICTRPIAESFCSKMWFNTYGSNPVACAIAREVLRIIEDEDIIGQCRDKGNEITEKVGHLCEKYPHVFKEVRGQGLFQGLQINGDTVEESQKLAYSIHEQLLDHNIVIGRGSAAGNVFRLQPPACVESENIDHLVNSLEDIVKKM